MFIRSEQRKRIIPLRNSTIDWTHPMTQGLLGCWLPGLGVGDLCGNTPNFTYIGANTTIVYTPDGPGMGGTGTNQMYAVTTPAIVKVFKQGMTLFWRGNILLSPTGGSANFAGITYDNANTSPYLVIGVGANSSGVNWQWNWNQAGAFNGPSGGPLPTGMHSTLMVVNYSNAQLTFYLDGIQNAQTTQTGTTAPSVTSTSEICISGLHADTTRNTDVLSNIVAYWNRTLSAQEALSLHLDPYQFIVADEALWDWAMPTAGPVFVLMPQIVT
jgi:hypothetical protein